MRLTQRPFAALCVLLAVVMAMAGSSRYDLSTLVIVRPIGVLVLCYALFELRAKVAWQHRYLVGLAVALAALPLLQLVPLPHAIWSSLPGRDIVVQIDEQLGFENMWRPLTLTPAATLNAFFAALLPLAAVLLGIQLSQRERHLLLPVLICVALLSGVLGVLQNIGSNGGPLYFYRITHDDSAVGLFANRNHQAAFLGCLFPMLSVFATTEIEGFGSRRWRVWFAVVAGAFLIPLILITGSRAGLAVGMAGFVLSVAFLLRRRRMRPISRLVKLTGLGLVAASVGLVWLALTLDRAEAIKRALAWDPSNDERFRIWQVSWGMVRDFFPAGSGLGSFPQIYQVYEPRGMLRTSYVNQAHNDWLEPLVTAGAAALVLMIAACLMFARRAWSVRGEMRQGGANSQFAWLGLVVISLLALASITDYPLRVPSLAAFFSVACVWASRYPVASSAEQRSIAERRLGVRQAGQEG